MAVIALVLTACGGQDKGSGPTEPDGDTGRDSPLVGTWHTTGEDPALGGPVDVLLEIQAAGTLRVTVTQSAGASLSFPGTWALVENVLQLRGAWFQPDGGVDVRWDVNGDVLILIAADGNSQNWERRR
jgi:hypothetical protein